MATFKQIIQDQTPEIQSLAEAVRELVLEVRPDARMEVETSWGGYLLFKQAVVDSNTVCFLSAHKKHVSLGFSQGAKLEDPSNLLKGTGRLQRHVKLKKPEELKNPALRDLLSRAWSLQPPDEVVQESLNRLRSLCLGLAGTSDVAATRRLHERSRLDSTARRVFSCTTERCSWLTKVTQP